MEKIKRAREYRPTKYFNTETYKNNGLWIPYFQYKNHIEYYEKACQELEDRIKSIEVGNGREETMDYQQRS